MLKVGEKFREWTIIRQLGYKNNSFVFLAVHQDGIQKRILKEFIFESQPNELNGLDNAEAFQAFQKRIYKEFNLVKTIDHPSFAKVYECVSTEQSVIVIRQYVEGISLENYINTFGTIDEVTGGKWIVAISKMLDYIHNMGLVHLDVKPSNFILKDGTITAIDLDSIRPIHNEEMDDSYGSLLYAAPERFISSKDFDIRSDIYSLGVMYYYFLSKNYPVIEGNYIPISKRKVHISKATEQVINKCLIAEPQNRYQSCKEVIGALNELLIPWKRFVAWQKNQGKKIQKNIRVSLIIIAVLIIIGISIIRFTQIPISSIVSVVWEMLCYLVNSILSNRSLTISTVLTALLVTIKVLVRQNKEFKEKLLNSLIELPIDILTVTIGYVGALIGINTLNNYNTFMFFLADIILALIICSMCYYVEYNLESKSVNWIAVPLCLGSSYIASLFMLFYTTTLR